MRKLLQKFRYAFKCRSQNDHINRRSLCSSSKAQAKFHKPWLVGSLSVYVVFWSLFKKVMNSSKFLHDKDRPGGAWSLRRWRRRGAAGAIIQYCCCHRFVAAVAVALTLRTTCAKTEPCLANQVFSGGPRPLSWLGL